MRPLPAYFAQSQHFCSWSFPSNRMHGIVAVVLLGAPRTLHWATAVAVFFLPKHCTRWGVDDMMGSLVVGLTGGRLSGLVSSSWRSFVTFFENPPRLERIARFSLRKGLCPRRAPCLIGWGRAPLALAGWAALPCEAGR